MTSSALADLFFAGIAGAAACGGAGLANGRTAACTAGLDSPLRWTAAAVDAAAVAATTAGRTQSLI